MKKNPFILFWLLNLFDAVATWYAIDVGQYAREANPAMAWAISHGWPLFFTIKVVIGTGIVWLVQKASSAGLPEQKKSVTRMMWVSAIFYGLVAVWHLIGFVLWGLKLV